MLLSYLCWGTFVRLPNLKIKRMQKTMLVDLEKRMEPLMEAKLKTSCTLSYHFSSEGFVYPQACWARVVSKGCTTLSLGAGDEPFKMEAVSFPLQTTVVWFFSTFATDRKPSKGGTEWVLVEATVMEEVEGAEEVSFLSGHREAAPMSFFEYIDC